MEDGRLKLGTTSTADARLDARLTQYENKVNNYSASQQPLDYILVVSLEVQLRDMVKNRELWSDDRLTATAVYVPGGASGVSPPWNRSIGGGEPFAVSASRSSRVA